jgi:hypothetical protein
MESVSRFDREMKPKERKKTWPAHKVENGASDWR